MTLEEKGKIRDSWVKMIDEVHHKKASGASLKEIKKLENEIMKLTDMLKLKGFDRFKVVQ